MARPLRYTSLSVPLLAGTAILLFSLIPLGPMDAAREWAFGAWQRLDSTPPASAQITIVDIDEASIARFGRWPWPRDILGRVLVHLRSARAVGIDILLSDRETNPGRADAALADKLQSTPVVLAAGANATPARTMANLASGNSTFHARNRLTPIRESGDDVAAFLPHIDTVMTPLEDFTTHAAGLGIAGANIAAGVVNAVPTVFLNGDVRWPNFTIEVLRVATRASQILVSAGSWGIDELHVGPLVIPTDRNGRIRPRFAYINSIPTLSAAILLDGAVPPDALHDKIVLLGVSAVGAGQTLATPLNQSVSSMAVEAALVQSALDNRLLSRPAAFAWLEGLAGLAFSGLIAASMARTGFPRTRVACLGGLLIPPAAAAVAFFCFGLLLDWVVPIACVAAAALASISQSAMSASQVRSDHQRAEAQARDAARHAATEATLRHEAEAAQQGLSLALDAADLAAWDTDLETHAWRYSPRFAAILGLTTLPERWTPDVILACLPQADRAKAEAALHGASGETFAFEFSPPQQTPARQLRITGRVWRDAQGSPRLAGIVADVTHERTMEARLRQAERLEAIGLLAGGVAHNFNNLLAIVLGRLDLARSRPTDARQADLLASAYNAAERGAHVARHLLGFARGRPVELRLLDASQHLRATAQLLRDSLPSRIELTTDIPDRLDGMEADPDELDLALLNLIINARDAMPCGGAIWLTAAREHIRKPAAGLDGHYLVIQVRDNGPGIDQAVLLRVFEPFVTTKPAGLGTGLGLSHVHGFATAAGGTVEIASTPGEGTTVRLYLPSQPAPVSSILDMLAPGVPQSVNRSQHAILLVEDDADLASCSSAVLAAEGYAVIEAHSAAEAMAQLRTDRRIDLLFTDVVMPGAMNGVQLAAAIRATRPNLPILLTTGYSNEVELGACNEFPLLQKPYRAQDLCRQAHTLLFGKDKPSAFEKNDQRTLIQ